MNINVMHQSFITTLNLVTSSYSNVSNDDSREKLIVGTNCGIIIIVQAKQVNNLLYLKKIFF